MNELPWSERVNVLSINPDSASRQDVANLAEDVQSKTILIASLQAELKASESLVSEMKAKQNQRDSEVLVLEAKLKAAEQMALEREEERDAASKSFTDQIKRNDDLESAVASLEAKLKEMRIALQAEILSVEHVDNCETCDEFGQSECEIGRGFGEKAFALADKAIYEPVQSPPPADEAFKEIVDKAVKTVAEDFATAAEGEKPAEGKKRA